MSLLGDIGSSLMGGLTEGITGGISSLVSGILGGGGQAAGTDLKKLRADALAAGFNPLTVLGATGGQGYQRAGLPALSSGAYLGEAISRGVDTFFNTAPAVDPQAKSIRAMNDYTAARMAARAANPYQSFGYALTDVQPFGQVVSAGGPKLARGGEHVGQFAGSAPLVVPTGSVPLPDPYLDRGSGLFNGGVYLAPSSGFSTAQQAEDQHGEIAGEYQGLIKWASDIGLSSREIMDKNGWLTPGVDYTSPRFWIGRFKRNAGAVSAPQPGAPTSFWSYFGRQF